MATSDEVRFLLLCVESTQKKPDFKVVSEACGITANGARKRFNRLKKLAQGPCMNPVSPESMSSASPNNGKKRKRKSKKVEIDAGDQSTEEEVAAKCEGAMRRTKRKSQIRKINYDECADELSSEHSTCDAELDHLSDSDFDLCLVSPSKKHKPVKGTKMGKQGNNTLRANRSRLHIIDHDGTLFPTAVANVARSHVQPAEEQEMRNIMTEPKLDVQDLTPHPCTDDTAKDQTRVKESADNESNMIPTSINTPSIDNHTIRDDLAVFRNGSAVRIQRESVLESIPEPKLKHNELIEEKVITNSISASVDCSKTGHDLLSSSATPERNFIIGNALDRVMTWFS